MDKITYSNSGVNIEAGEQTVNLIKPLVKQTFNENVLSHIGGFGGLYNIDLSRWNKPVLVSSVDGVGTKIMVAEKAGIYDTVGQDLVNHCVNDIFVQGAIPQYFMDYIGLGRLIPETVEKIISGLTKACRENEIALIGGEMAEMPGVYKIDDFDLVGMIVGMVEKERIITGSKISEHDVIIGFPSTGLHTNGYSLARRIFFDILKMDLSDRISTDSKTIGEMLLAVHRSYYPLLIKYVEKDIINGMAHITGGGLPGNIKRIMPDGLSAVIRTKTWEIPELFQFMQNKADIDNEEVYRAFNMGIGFVTIVDATNVDAILRETDGMVIGEIIKDSSDSRVKMIYA
ncbi:MAG: phosphoribosylformylglycinamidine cyclo-ligase [Candidatus Cloacimonetes bacterium]|nr:phosphoribosylformylglycinamidine cyclo-ligase [Candidatus Cloacimonadota bacterium]